MKKTILLGLLALATLGVHAQKKVKLKKFDPATAIQTKTDSLSYALGQNMTVGLRDHLVTSEVLKDSTATDFDAKANSIDLQTFLDGLVDALAASDKKEEKYNAGIAVGNQLTAVTKNFEKDVLKGTTLNKDIFIHAIVSAVKGEKSYIANPQEYFQAEIMKVQQEEELKRAEELKAISAEKIAEGTKFLAENSTKEGVVALPSGLQYKILTEGTGEKPTSADQVTVHYEGRLLDGTVFDSSYKRSEPATFGVTQVIPGWIEALQLMPVGSKWVIYIPQDLAYRDRDSGPIPPFSTLVFDIELIDIKK